ncbi:hypothetical protein S40293_09319 [Stachybotrys chartarum IBT 40293]|nr:hypothetical protein S40293_09319 [Stachybotrys chartarum IBT 40293]
MPSQETIWMYDTSFPLAVFRSVLYGIVSIAISYFTLIKYRARYFIAVVIGAAVEVAAYCVRSYSSKNQAELIILAVMAPVFVAAGNYLLISRLIIAVLPPEKQLILGTPGRRLTPIFVTFDVMAFLVQGNGSALASSNNWAGHLADIGVYIIISGLALQVLAFGLFLTVFSRFHYLALRNEVDNSPWGWKWIVPTIYISSILIMASRHLARLEGSSAKNKQIRCIFRVIEFAEGIDGYIYSHEWMFWVFEALAMLIAIGVFCLFHPSI